MRYPDSGGLAAQRRARRARVRLQAAQMFEQENSPVQVARQLRVSTKSVYQWRRSWRAGGQAALAARGPGGGGGRLSAGAVGRARHLLGEGPAGTRAREHARCVVGGTARVARALTVRATP